VTDRTLFVVLGAGSSYAAASEFKLGARPPLTSELFDRRFEYAANRYPMLGGIVPEIRDAIGLTGLPDAVSLEEHLRRRYRDSPDELDQRRFLAIALYLQDILMSFSDDTSIRFDNIDRLVTSLLRGFGHVCFITLNYDLVLDRSLNDIAPLRDLGDFVAHDRWSLIKLHGSVTWTHDIRDGTEADVENPPADLVDRVSEGINHQWTLSAARTRRRIPSDDDYSHVEPNVFFPALSLPLGSDDEIVCPPAHQEFLAAKLRAADELDLLVIGYSAYDQAVVKKLVEAERRVRSLCVVNSGEREAADVLGRLAPPLGMHPGAEGTDAVPEDFGSWVLQPMQDWIASHPAATRRVPSSS
jgi:hypothetical protein